MSTIMPGGQTLAGAIAGFAGSGNPPCNYTSPLAKKFIYRETSKVFRPLRRHIFRQKVKTAAEVRFFEIQKSYMIAKTGGEKFGPMFVTSINPSNYEHCGSIIPKDEYEIKKFTSYMTSKKLSEDYRKHMQDLWTKFLFIAHSTNYVGMLESASYQNVRPATDEEFMSWIWFSTFLTTSFAFTFTLLYWWWKFGQAPEYSEVI